MDDQKNKFASDSNITPINGAPFYSKFLLQGEDGSEIDFSKSSIVSLDLQENFFEPFVVATMTVNNPFDVIEDTVPINGDGTERMKVTFYNASLTEEERAGRKLPPIKDIQVESDKIHNKIESVKEGN